MLSLSNIKELVVPHCDRKTQYFFGLTCKEASNVFTMSFWRNARRVVGVLIISKDSSDLSAHMQRISRIILHGDRHREEMLKYFTEGLYRVQEYIKTDGFMLETSNYCSVEEWSITQSNWEISAALMIVIRKLHSMGNVDLASKFYNEWKYILPKGMISCGCVTIPYNSVIKGKTTIEEISEDECEVDWSDSDSDSEGITKEQVKNWCDEFGYRLIPNGDWHPSTRCECITVNPVISRGYGVLEVACGNCVDICSVCMHAMTDSNDGKCYECI